MFAIETRAVARKLGHGIALGLLAWCVAGCSQLARLGVGPVVARPDGSRAATGDELRVREGVGSSNGTEVSLLETEGRLVVTERTQALSLGVGPAYLRWFGPAALTVSLTPAFGAEYFDHTAFATAGVHGGLGLGFVLSGSERQSHPWGPWWPELETLNLTFVRRRTLLTLELAGAADARSRGTSLMAGVLIGIAWSDEQYEVEAPSLMLRRHF
jgi:hypothetical protein